ncbi:response regulator [Phaeospirillum tilakii]|uniref:Response regulator n=1 Tax=Phaeospirillum tilakii TaxID=741673 RepID=A0ABW5C893_9PROT
MNVLIVEDDPAKASQLRAFVQTLSDGAQISEARSIQTALRRLAECKPDFVVLDMSLPTFDPGPDEPGGKPQGFGGREVLRRIERAKLACKVFVVTQYETFGKKSDQVTLQELTEDLRRCHPTVFVGSVYYSSATDDWKEELADLICLER